MTNTHENINTLSVREFATDSWRITIEQFIPTLLTVSVAPRYQSENHNRESEQVRRCAEWADRSNHDKFDVDQGGDSWNRQGRPY